MNYLRALMIVSWFAVFAQTALAQCSSWIEGQGVAGVRGSIRAMTSWDPDGEGPERPLLVVLGQFLQAGDSAVNNIAAWDGTRWLPLGTGFTIPSDAISPMFALGTFRGQLVAAVSNIGSSAQIRLWNGQVWSAVPGPSPYSITCLAEYQDKLIVGTADSNYGTFEGGRFLAAFNGNSWQTGYAGGISSAPAALAVHNGHLIVSGTIKQAGILPVSAIARWDGLTWSELETGLASASANADGSVLLSIGQDLIAGGTFDFAGGEAAKNVAIWNGAFWQAMGAGMATPVRSLTFYNGSICAATDSGVFRWTGWMWQPLGGQLGGGIRSLVIHEGSLFAGGFLVSTADWGFRGVAKLEGDAWVGVSKGLPVDLETVQPFNGGVCVGLSGLGNTPALRFWDGRRWSDPFSSASEYWSRVTAMGSYGGELVVAGDLVARGSATNTSLVIAAWRNGRWNMIGATFNGSINAIATFRGELFVGGDFTRIGTTSAGSIARWDGVAWKAIGGTNGRVRALAVLGDDLILAGSFSAVGSISAPNIAAWTPSGFRTLAGGLNSEVRALAVHQGSLIAAGSFNRSGTSVNAIGLARWNGTAWSSVPGWSRTGVVALLSCNDGSILLGGTFGTNVTDGFAANVAEWRDGVWRTLGSGLSGGVSALASVQDERIFVGAFGFAGGKPSYGLARWTTTGVPQLSKVSPSARVMCSEEVSLAVEVSQGYPSLSFRWLRNGVEIDAASNPTAASPVLRLGSALAAADGLYECRVSNLCGERSGTARIVSDCCPADLDDDARVDDRDFGLFAADYNVLDCGASTMPLLCASDLNRDGVVDDLDFELFAVAYDELECAP